MSANGAFLFILHSHLPYARLTGRWPHGEEWLHEAVTETYIPLLETLYNLKADDIPFRITIGLTPILCEQLSDDLVLDHLDKYLDLCIMAAQRDMTLFAPANVTQLEKINGDDIPSQPQTGAHTGDPDLYNMAQWYKQYYERIKYSFNERFKRDIIGAFRQLQDDGLIEIVVSAATHAYLPLLRTASSIRAQLEVGIASYERHFKRKPAAIWLPECAYRPAITLEDGTTLPGIEDFLAEYDLQLFFTETHAITGGDPVGVPAGDVIGPYGAVQQRYVVPDGVGTMRRKASTFLPYFVSQVADGAAEDVAHSSVVVLGRNDTTGQQVWSNDWGYPGDFDYREFNKHAGSSGLKYWRVTDNQVDLAHKEIYHPEWAAYKVEQHAEHFAHLVGDLLRDYKRHTDQYGVITAQYDAELFGHWWFEGVSWLGKVLRHLATRDDIDLNTASQFIAEHPPQHTLTLPESSRGAGGKHFTWDNGETHWLWEPIHTAAARMQALADAHLDTDDDTAKVLAQAAREVLLMQSSDWAFLITSGQAREYASRRFTQHLQRFEQLADSVEAGVPDTAYAEEIYELDKIFPNIDYRVFRSRAD